MRKLDLTPPKLAFVVGTRAARTSHSIQSSISPVNLQDGAGVVGRSTARWVIDSGGGSRVSVSHR